MSGRFPSATKFPDSAKPKTYLTNYILLALIVCGQYYKDYDHVMGTLRISHCSERKWIPVIGWIAPEMEKLPTGVLTRLANYY